MKSQELSFKQLFIATLIIAALIAGTYAFGIFDYEPVRFENSTIRLGHITASDMLKYVR